MLSNKIHPYISEKDTDISRTSLAKCIPCTATCWTISLKPCCSLHDFKTDLKLVTVTVANKKRVGSIWHMRFSISSHHVWLLQQLQTESRLTIQMSRWQATPNQCVYLPSIPLLCLTSVLTLCGMWCEVLISLSAFSVHSTLMYRSACIGIAHTKL